MLNFYANWKHPENRGILIFPESIVIEHWLEMGGNTLQTSVHFLDHLILVKWLNYLHSFISHTQLKSENVKRKWMHCRQNFSNLAFQTAHGCQMRQPLPKKYTPTNRPTTSWKWKFFWPPPKIQNFQIPTPPTLGVGGGGGVHTM